MRLRANLAYGTITDAPLLIGATTMNSAELGRLPAVASPDVAVVTLDWHRANGEPEIVHVTAHAAGATSATIVRAAEDATKYPERQHPAGTRWDHAFTVADWAEKVPLPGVDGTVGQVLAIASLDPLTTVWVDAGTTTTNALLTESGDTLTTEAGDTLTQEAA